MSYKNLSHGVWSKESNSNQQTINCKVQGGSIVINSTHYVHNIIAVEVQCTILAENIEQVDTKLTDMSYLSVTVASCSDVI